MFDRVWIFNNSDKQKQEANLSIKFVVQILFEKSCSEVQIWLYTALYFDGKIYTRLNKQEVNNTWKFV
jgi:hypothetical protein